MIWFHLAVAIIFIIIGSRLGGVGVGLAGGAGCIVLVATGLHTKVAEDIPWTVIGIIMTVICAIAALQLAGGMDYLVHLAEVMLRKHPNQINYLAPLTTFLLSLLCGTGHTAYSVLPVIVEVAKEHKIRPSRPLSIAVVASQVAVASSPISAATLALVGVLEPLGVGYLEILAVTIPTTFIGCAVGAVVASRQGKDLIDDPIYQEREAKGLVSHNAAVADTGWRPKRTAIPSLVAFLVALVVVVGYATVSSEEVGVLTKPPMTSSAAIMLIMLTTAMIICMMSREDVKQLTTQTTFRAGMSAAICILGLAWLGNMFVNNYMDVLTHAGGLDPAFGPVVPFGDPVLGCTTDVLPRCDDRRLHAGGGQDRSVSDGDAGLLPGCGQLLPAAELPHDGCSYGDGRHRIDASRTYRP